MSDYSPQLLKAVVASLRAGIPAVGGRVFSDVPQKTDFPYVMISTSSTPFAANDFSGQDHTLRVQVFSQKDSKGESLLIQSAIVNFLDRQEQNINLEAGTLIKCEFSLTDMPFKEDDGRTWQAMCELLVTTV